LLQTTVVSSYSWHLAQCLPAHLAPHTASLHVGEFEDKPKVTCGCSHAPLHLQVALWQRHTCQRGQPPGAGCHTDGKHRTNQLHCVIGPCRECYVACCIAQSVMHAFVHQHNSAYAVHPVALPHCCPHMQEKGEAGACRVARYNGPLVVEMTPKVPGTLQSSAARFKVRNCQTEVKKLEH